MKQLLIVALTLVLASQLALNATNPPYPAARPRGETQSVPDPHTVYIQEPCPERDWFRWDALVVVVGSIATGIAVGHFWPRNQKSS